MDMNVQEIVVRCHELGVSLILGTGGKLGVRPAGKLPGELREELRRHKAEILAVLLAEEAEEARPCSCCGKPAKVEEVDGEGRTFWTCTHCHATGCTPREPGKPYTPQDKPSPLKELYRQATAEISNNYLPVISWLIEHHPQRWEEIRKADDCLSEIEKQGGSTEKKYHVALEHFLNLLREAKQDWETRHVLYNNGKGVKVWIQ